MFELADPWVLLALPLPLLAARLLNPQPVSGRALLVPDHIGSAMLQAGRAQESTRLIPLRQMLLWVIWALTLLALSGPRDLEPVSALKVSGRDLAVALDLSGSMVRDDFYLDGRQITRLEAVTTVGADFARRRGGDRVALIVFGSEAYFATPFTFDVEAVARRIEEASIGISGRATNISDGLGLALKRLADSEAASRVVILLSDGVNNAGATNPRGVAELAAAMGVRVHTIALGPKDLDSAEIGERGVVDTTTLRAIAQVSGGESFRVKTTDDLVAVAEALDRLEATDSDGLAAEIYHDYWPWPAALAVVLGCLALWREAA
ncbi:VWA domain-containing protein [Ruegeria sp. 2205SS24-7]|uniref:VWA domain-containing protein n=1 Tax=Ruegeria discodermiae TaxID=3064389 RepID=UPI002741A9D5|nr:VWA domain-containing protein [Ruegeria sp. 2205SS24-7]MDP5217059.1 VWA domain-containing protein [Ruegeria sp. 2205SS24-7]